jgi:hypothetical protein
MSDILSTEYWINEHCRDIVVDPHTFQLRYPLYKIDNDEIYGYSHITNKWHIQYSTIFRFKGYKKITKEEAFVEMI